MSPRAPTTSTAGYSLVELLVVLAIMGLLAVAAVPMLSASRPGLQAKAVAEAIGRDLVAARQAAIDGGAEEHFGVNPATGRYGFSQNTARIVPKGIAIAIQGRARSEIDFYPDGSTSGGVIVVSGGKAHHRVAVHWPGGEVAVDE